MTTAPPAMLAATAFLTEIGLSWRWAPGVNGFIPGIDIVDGVLLISPDARVSGLLHEAGHLACLPGDFRPLAQRNMSSILKLMFEHLGDLAPDSELERAILQCSDPEATAWAWAAGEHLGMVPEDIILADEYDNYGAELRFQLMARAYVGIHGLHHAGFCAIRAGAYALKTGQAVYPKLNRWLQKDFGHAGAAALRAMKAAPERIAA